jgi:excisionase family DNA binding protein
MIDEINEPSAPAQEASSDDLLGVEEAAQFLGTSQTTLYRLLRQGDLKGLKVGRQWRFRKPDLTAYMERGPVAISLPQSQDLDEEMRFFGAEAGANAEEKVAALARSVVTRAIAAGASDIHLEPQSDHLLLRYRIDGVLHEIREIARGVQNALIHSIKAMAEMNLEEKRLPQDGRIAFRDQGREYDLRVSLVPLVYGEAIVMRILDRSSVLIGLDRLGFDPEGLAKIRQWCGKPQGLIIATGPTGSGKTTLLYSCLSAIASTAVKTVTVEDPVEYILPLVNQMQVNIRAGLKFAGAMRSFLRQDPDVIMCGETRDLETANLCVEAALTGHMVFSTLHTPDSVGAVTRLLDMGVERFLISATLVGIVSPRLIRLLCPHCKRVADEEITQSLLAEVEKDAANGGYGPPADANYYTSAGCEKCRRTGYLGRTGLYEMLTWSPALSEALRQGATEREMTKIAVSQGMRTLLAEGMQRAVAGETSIEEVMRVTGHAAY